MLVGNFNQYCTTHLIKGELWDKSYWVYKPGGLKCILSIVISLQKVEKH